MKHVNGVAERNKQIITALLQRFGSLSREQIYGLTHIRRSTTSKLVRELIEEEVLLEDGLLDTPMGRKQALLRLNEESRFAVGIEFDDESVTVALTDLHPRVRKVVTQPTNHRDGQSGLIAQLKDCVQECLRETGIGRESLIGIGIADPGLVDSRKGVTVMSTTIDFWRDVPLKQIFEEAFLVPAFVELKTRAKTVAERLLGAGERADNLIYVDYGAGIGAGIVLDGKLLLGRNCAAGEFGHTLLADHGPICKCGSYGCLEALAGLRAVETKVRKAWAAAGIEAGVFEQEAGIRNGWDMFRAAANGDKICASAADEVATCLGLGVANLINLFNPSVVVLDQRLQLAGPGMLEQIVRVAKRQALVASTRDVVFRFSQLGREAGILGAALICLEHYFQISLLKPPRFLVDPDCELPPLPETAGFLAALAE